MSETHSATFEGETLRAAKLSRIMSALLLFLIALVAAIGFYPRFFPQVQVPSPLRTVFEKGELIVLTRHAPGVYQETEQGTSGFDGELAKSFARYLGKEVRFVPFDTTRDLLDALHFNMGHLAAGGLVRSQSREEAFLFGPEFRRVQQVVVGSSRGPRIKELADLNRHRIVVRAGSGQEELLLELKNAQPKLKWHAIEGASADQLLKSIRRSEAEFAVMDSTTANMQLRIHPEYKIQWALTSEEAVAWPLALDAHFLEPELKKWACEIEASGELELLRDRYFGYMGDFATMDLQAYKRSIRELLPNLEPLFREASALYGFQWTLLAAVAYQESQWDLEAESHTGVRGLMMLTEQTARELGVMNREDPYESVLGGSRYLAQLRDRLPDSIVEPDRTWFALAAYNVGMGHLLDAMSLTKAAHRNPDRWVDVRQFLPKLAEPHVAAKLRHGHARGQEPVSFVQKVRDLYQILERRSSKGKSTTHLF